MTTTSPNWDCESIEPSTEHPLRFVNGNELRALENDEVLTLTDIWGAEA